MASNGGCWRRSYPGVALERGCNVAHRCPWHHAVHRGHREATASTGSTRDHQFSVVPAISGSSATALLRASRAGQNLAGAGGLQHRPRSHRKRPHPDPARKEEPDMWPDVRRHLPMLTKPMSPPVPAGPCHCNMPVDYVESVACLATTTTAAVGTTLSAQVAGRIKTEQ